ncbi:hypothetical protein [Sinorhizobium meliloti]|nr:hypothetical protein [Sinorhizobium meliloti]TWA94087.1 hypothetical protein FB000_12350 [Ensifer sp. SEMIA 134]TWB30302.1 hypothetical protein FB001_12065 [Ensifer sp. SEMIA 135]
MKDERLSVQKSRHDSFGELRVHLASNFQRGFAFILEGFKT